MQVHPKHKSEEIMVAKPGREVILSSLVAVLFPWFVMQAMAETCVIRIAHSMPATHGYHLCFCLLPSCIPSRLRRR